MKNRGEKKNQVNKRKIKRINCPSIENELKKKSNSRCCFRRRHINGMDQFFTDRKRKRNANEKRLKKQLTDMRAYVVHMTFAFFSLHKSIAFWVWMESAEIYHTLEPKCQPCIYRISTAECQKRHQKRTINKNKWFLLLCHWYGHCFNFILPCSSTPARFYFSFYRPFGINASKAHTHKGKEWMKFFFYRWLQQKWRAENCKRKNKKQQQQQKRSQCVFSWFFFFWCSKRWNWLTYLSLQYYLDNSWAMCHPFDNGAVEYPNFLPNTLMQPFSEFHPAMILFSIFIWHSTRTSWERNENRERERKKTTTN